MENFKPASRKTALACLLISFAATGCTTDAKTSKSAVVPTYNLVTAYAAQTPRVQHDCFPDDLKIIIAHIKARTGVQPVVTSGHRPKSGRKGSQHRHCQAADIRVPGVSESKIVAAAKSAPGIGGIGTYCNGIVHVDIGPKRSWRHC